MASYSFELAIKRCEVSQLRPVTSHPATDASLVAMDKITPALQTYSILAGAMAAGVSCHSSTPSSNHILTGLGANLSTSVITFPALRHASGPTLLMQWQTLYDSGVVPVVTSALTSALGFATLAYRATLVPTLSPSDTTFYSKRNLYVAAAVALVGLAPYTRIVMGRTIDELSRRATTGKVAGEKTDTRALVERWGTLNLWRGVMLLTGTGLGLWASVRV